MSYIGNLPFGKTLRTVTSITADGVATVFYPDGGYDVNFVDVFVSGARLSSGLDFTAADGVSVTLLYTPVNGDTIDIVSYGLLELINPVFPSTLGVGSNVVINTSSISVGNSTVNSIITSNSITIGGNLITSGNSSVQGLLKIVDSVSNTSSSIAASANSVTTAYTLAANAVSNATAYAATAYSNAITYASNASNISTGTLATAILPATANISTAINVGANVNLTTTYVNVGNSTVNTTITSNNIFTSGTITGRIEPRVNNTTANTGTYSINTDLYDTFIITGQTVAITSITTTGTPVNSQKLWVSITSTNTSINFSTANFEATTIALPTTVVASTRLDVGFIWNTTTTKWRCVATA